MTVKEMGRYGVIFIGLFSSVTLAMDSSMVPTISVVIPTYDRPDKLARLLPCIKQQSYNDFECLVIDDGSRDDTLTKYDAIWNTLDDRFLLHLKGKNERGGGPGKSRNIGIRLARGTFVAFCDDDDMWIRDDHLSDSVAALTACEADLFFANMQASEDGNARLRRVARSRRAWYTVELARLILQEGRRRQTCELATQALLLHPSGGALRLIANALLGR